MPKNKLNYDSIRDEHLDALIRLAYRQADALEAQEILEGDVRALNPEEEELCRRAYARFQQRVEAQDRADRRRASIGRWRRRASRFVGVAACVVLLLGIAAPIAIAKVDFIRVRVLQLLIDVQEEYTELSLVEDEAASFDVPMNWRGAYYPSYIPEGYELSDLDPLVNDVVYTNSKGERIVFSECDQATETNIDSEDAVLSYDAVNGATALILEKNGTMISWSDGIKYFIVLTDIPKEESLKIANSVRRIS